MDSIVSVQLLLAAALQGGMYMLFGRFVEPRWRTLPMIAFYLLITWILAGSLGWWGLAWVIGYPALEVLAHAALCRRHGVDWVRCEPREVYLRHHPLGGPSAIARLD